MQMQHSINSSPGLKRLFVCFLSFAALLLCYIPVNAAAAPLPDSAFDFNRNGRVQYEDLLVLSTVWNQETTFTGDGGTRLVGAEELLMLIEAWRRDVPIPTPTPTPTLTIMDVHICVITKNPSAHARATLNQVLKEVDILNMYFRTVDHRALVDFRFKSVDFYEDVKDLNCQFVALGDSKAPYSSNGWAAVFNACPHTQVRDPHAINFFIYDSYVEGSGFDDITSHGKRNSNRPYVLIDWERLDHRVQSPEEHEMGHAFGLGHVCHVGATINSDTNIMASSANCNGSGGKRNIGFGETQEATIRYYTELISNRLSP
jgi:hypothetical protein